MEPNKTCYLTTVDNPFNPDTQFDLWLDFDIRNGYYSCAYLDRVARISPAMSEVEKEQEIERAVDEIIFNDFRNIYTKIYVDKQPEVPEEGESDDTESLDKILNRDDWKENRN